MAAIPEHSSPAPPVQSGQGRSAAFLRSTSRPVAFSTPDNSGGGTAQASLSMLPSFGSRQCRSSFFTRQSSSLQRQTSRQPSRQTSRQLSRGGGSSRRLNAPNTHWTGLQSHLGDIVQTMQRQVSRQASKPALRTKTARFAISDAPDVLRKAVKADVEPGSALERAASRFERSKSGCALRVQQSQLGSAPSLRPSSMLSSLVSVRT